LCFFIFGLYRKNKSKDFDFEIFSFVLFIVVSVFFLLLGFFSEMSYFLVISCLDGDFFVTKFIILAKMFILSVFGVYMLVFYFIKDEGYSYFEFCLLILCSILGTFLLLMSNNLMCIYLSLELQSFVLYILPIISVISGNWFKEASFKYFVFGVIGSSLILLGISFIYGFCGTLKLHQLIKFLDFNAILNIEFRFLIGFLFVFLGIFLKLGAAPFHY
jgi:NADH-quinone oxidoreductase subunit N